MRTIVLLLLLGALSARLLAATPDRAEQMTLSPPASEVAMRAYGLGVIPFDGKFTRFHGLLRYDPATPSLCQVMLEIDAGSLVMPDPAMRDEVTGPQFIDAAHYPLMTFEGACAPRAVTGTLDMHGQSHPFTLDLAHDGGTLTATGRLRRAEWGITAQPFRVGHTIRIQVRLPDPLPRLAGASK